jgi:hypothetical protein
MGHYRSNVRDLEFNLFEKLDLEKALATGEFGDLDGESVRQMLDEAARLAEGPVAESFAYADRNPPTFDPETHTVHLPESFKKSLRAWQPDGTWHLDGVKRFITNGDSDDLFENIIHLVLARPEGAGPGTKGLSLFVVPKFLFDPETGEPRRAQRGLCHRSRPQDGPEGLSHMRTHLRSTRPPGRRLAGR